MMGEKSPERKIFYMFDLDKRVAEGHLLRQVSRAVDFNLIYSKARKRFGRDVYERFFRHVVVLSEKVGLIKRLVKAMRKNRVLGGVKKMLLHFSFGFSFLAFVF